MAQTSGGVLRDLGATSGHARSNTPVPYAVSGLIVAIGELLVIVATAFVCGVAYHLTAHSYAGSYTEYAGVSALFGVLYLTRMHSLGAYWPEALTTGKSSVGNVASAWLFALSVLAGAIYLLKIGPALSRGFIVSFGIAGFCTVVLARSSFCALIRWARESRVLSARQVLLLGEPAELADSNLTNRLRTLGYSVQDVIALDFASPDSSAAAVVSAVRQARARPIEDILLCVNWSHLDQAETVLENLRVLPLPILLVADRRVRSLLSHNVSNVGPMPAIEVQRAPLTSLEQGMKRTLDVICATLGLIVLAPLLAIVAIAIKIDSPGPVLFRQTRIGFGGRSFRIFKFRTMTVTEDGAVIRQATRIDKRVTRAGRILRATSIDELPQLLNVLLGEMSVVGPRPHALAHDNQYTRLINNYAFRHHMKPGITGWAQVRGFRGETPTVDLMQQRVACDLWYINNWTIWLDIKTLFLTVVNLPKQSSY